VVGSLVKSRRVWTNFDGHHNPNPGYRVTYLCIANHVRDVRSIYMRLFEPSVSESINGQVKPSCC
jgi:hypothetical protein